MFIEIKGAKKQYGSGETQMDNMMTSMGGLIYAFMIIGMIVCIASLYATINTMISENSQNISMLKVLGYENRRINSMILSSNYLLLIPGIAFGIMAWYCAEFVAIESIQKALKTLTDGHTVIMIAHRLSTVVGVDNIIVLDNGHIVEEGRHNELSSGRGLYARMWKEYNQAVRWKIASVKEGA